MAQIKSNRGGGDGRDPKWRRKRAAENPAENLDRFATSSDDEAKPKRKKVHQPVAAAADGSSTHINPTANAGGKRASKRARHQLAKQAQLEKEKQESASTDGIISTKKQAPVPASSGEEKVDESSKTKTTTLSPSLVKELTESAPAPKKKKKVEPEKKTAPSPSTGWKLKDGVVANDLRVGTGKPAKPGCKVSITYEGSLLPVVKSDAAEDVDADEKTGEKVIFDQNLDKDDPLIFTIGSGEVVEGMEVGVAGMKAGGKRLITIPPPMGYGDEGSPPKIPGGATLQFEVELLSFKAAPKKKKSTGRKRYNKPRD